MSSVFQLRHGVNAVKICGLLDIQESDHEQLPWR